MRLLTRYVLKLACVHARLKLSSVQCSGQSRYPEAYISPELLNAENTGHRNAYSQTKETTSMTMTTATEAGVHRPSRARFPITRPRTRGAWPGRESRGGRSPHRPPAP